MVLQSIPKSNLHTHSTFCDGRDTPEEIVRTAIGMGMESLGFSSHSTVTFDVECGIRPDQNAAYRDEILRLRDLYGRKLHILLGIEQDIFGDDPPTGYDFVIGSCHYLKKGDRYLPVDYSREVFEEIVRDYFGGDVYAFTREYFETVATVVAKTDCDIIGHFDLISKFNGNRDLFDESDRRYRDPAMDALDVLIKTDRIFEINTGAASRGYRNIPYPNRPFLKRIVEKGARVTFSSDAHAKENLMFGFNDALFHATSCGLSHLTVMTAHGWQDFKVN